MSNSKYTVFSTLDFNEFLNINRENIDPELVDILLSLYAKDIDNLHKSFASVIEDMESRCKEYQ